MSKVNFEYAPGATPLDPNETDGLIPNYIFRFHHRLVLIHPFPNGNGRHARLMTDLLFLKFGRIPFTWGNGKGAVKLESHSDARLEYIQALREADQKKFARLIQFVKS